MAKRLKACKLLNSRLSVAGKQGFDYLVGISAESAEATGIHMQLLTIPPGTRAKAHKHRSHETAIYAIQGTSHVWHGEQLEHHTAVEAGSFFYIPADVPHLPYNASATEPATVVIARTDANEQESVELLPELDAMLAKREAVQKPEDERP